MSGHNVLVTLPTHPLRRSWIVPTLIVVIGTLPWMYHYLLLPDAGHWMADMQVYREAGVSLLSGRPVYEYVTPAPQNLPFTYPPFAAFLAIPLAWIPATALGWIWFYAQIVAAVGLVRLAAASLLDRLGRHRELVWGLGALALAYTLPIGDGLRFGQVNAFLVLACLLEVARPDLLRRVRLPQGVLVGLATAIKLTPGVFIVYFLITRQWRAAATSIVTCAVVTLGSFLVAPGLSITFWGDALLDPNRLGHNDGTANQSLRAVVLRLGLEGSLGVALWLLLALAVAVVGFAAARRAYEQRDLVLAFSLVGVVSVLVSPVSWSHHFHWVLPAVCWLVAYGIVHRARGRLAAGALLWLALTLHLTWWAHYQLVAEHVFRPEDAVGSPFWRVLHNAYCIAGLVTLIGLARLAWRPAQPSARPVARDDLDSQRSGSPVE